MRGKLVRAAVLLVAALSATLISSCGAPDSRASKLPLSSPKPRSAASAEEASMSGAMKTEQAILGGGCFWCLEAVYELVPGVLDATNGYAGGSREHPSYEEVSSGRTGHAEVVRITFDPSIVSFARLLDYFWKIHDPTTEDRQGADIGSQYRSVIFYDGEAQRLAAEASMREAQKARDAAIVTELIAVPRFWIAEAYHQDYFRNHPEAGYCRIVIAPKVKKAGF